MKTLIQFINEANSSSKFPYEKYLKKEGMEQELREWYQKEFKDDELGEELPSDTLAMVLAALFNNPEEFEENYCAQDSVVRERIFHKLSELCDEDYDTFYEYWLNN